MEFLKAIRELLELIAGRDQGMLRKNVSSFVDMSNTQALSIVKALSDGSGGSGGAFQAEVEADFQKSLNYIW